MKNSITLNIITKNEEKNLRRALESIKGLVDKIILVDNNSSDATLSIAKEYGATIFSYSGNHLGEQRKIAFENTKTKWILVLDADERVSSALANEIQSIINSSDAMDAYFIPIQSFFLHKKLEFGGEQNKKLLLFKKHTVRLKNVLVHEKFESTSTKTGVLNNYLSHYSYPSILYVYKKFTYYAKKEAEQKAKNGETTTIKKLILYPLHMFWNRFVKEKGYRDGVYRVPLDLGFAYMEFLTYVFLLQKQNKI